MQRKNSGVPCREYKPFGALRFVWRPTAGLGERSSFGSQLRNLRETVPGQIIVRYDEGTGQAQQAAVRREEGVVKKADLDLINADMVKVQGETVAAAVEDLEANPDVEYAVPDRVVYPTQANPGDRFSKLWGLENTGQTILGREGTPDIDVDASAAAAK